MNHINKILLTAALGSTLLALESCRKADTDRLIGRWRVVGGDPFLRPNEEMIFEFDRDGEFREEKTTYYNFYQLLFGEGDWEWRHGKKLDINVTIQYDYGTTNFHWEFEVILINNNSMELRDNNYSLEFKKE